MTHSHDGFGHSGLVGAWSPGIGDPSLEGWLVVGLYSAACWAVWRLVSERYSPSPAPVVRERWFWKVMLVGLVGLGINKQLDLQTALTEVGRMAASRGGWYQARHQVQTAFIATLAVLALCVFALLVNAMRGAPASTSWAALGGGGLLLFVVLRAAAFHHVGARLGHFSGDLIVGWRWEAANLMVILASAHRRSGSH